VIHATHAYLESYSPRHALVKLNFVTAFISIHQDSIFEAVSKFLPDILPFVISAYEEPSSFFFSEFGLASAERNSRLIL